MHELDVVKGTPQWPSDKRYPDWLNHSDRVAPVNKTKHTEELMEFADVSDLPWVYDQISQFRLHSQHWAAKIIRKGLVPFVGECQPDNWDGEGVLLRNGDIALADSLLSVQWGQGKGILADWEIIGYRAKEESEEMPETKIYEGPSKKSLELVTKITGLGDDVPGFSEHVRNSFARYLDRYPENFTPEIAHDLVDLVNQMSTSIHQTGSYEKARQIQSKLFPLDPLELLIENILSRGNDMTAYEIAGALREEGPDIGLEFKDV